MLWMTGGSNKWAKFANRAPEPRNYPRLLRPRRLPRSAKRTERAARRPKSWSSGHSDVGDLFRRPQLVCELGLEEPSKLPRAREPGKGHTAGKLCCHWQASEKRSTASCRVRKGSPNPCCILFSSIAADTSTPFGGSAFLTSTSAGGALASNISRSRRAQPGHPSASALYDGARPDVVAPMSSSI